MYVSPWALAMVYVGLGERDHALELLAQSISERSPQPALFLSGEPRLDALRSEPRFRAMEQDLFGPAAIPAALPATPPETLR